MEKKTFIYGVGPFRLPWTTFIMETMRARSLYLKNTVRKFPKKSKEKFHKESKEKPYQNIFFLNLDLIEHKLYE
jgi:hypothetical protein